MRYEVKNQHGPLRTNGVALWRHSLQGHVLKASCARLAFPKVMTVTFVLYTKLALVRGEKGALALLSADNMNMMPAVLGREVYQQ